ncbi:54S ribosomal protein L31, mitochondrial [Golovinomyces cichoracearum]|uniref:54S ribosomal protein L31, mitochondrial n=1 Tax=Golovinomyces cichoracearum TaxID=62708 RepID=A0A420HA09_9PEZI|nr:54S ribosomal protein L31, mitochondrial [Golovinomyces cichoracearum]
MFGAFRQSNPLSGGLLWKIPWRLSRFQKARQRKRLRAVDAVVSVVDKALAKQGLSAKAVEFWKKEMPYEQEMLPKDKYTIFDRKEKKYRKTIRSRFEMVTYLVRKIDYSTELPKWTRVSQRINPPGY